MDLMNLPFFVPKYLHTGIFLAGRCIVSVDTGAVFPDSLFESINM